MNRDDIVTAALDVLDTWGFEFCSMRRVAGALNVQPSALYHHVENKQTLLGLMAERIVAGVVPHAPEGAREVPPVKEDLVGTSHRLRDAMLAVRDGAEVVATASAFRLGLSELEGDLAKQSSPDVARTLLIYVIGHTQATQLHRQASALGAIQADPDLDPSFARGLAILLD
ncbi:MAG: TetR/AcrR family transcriptional regulator [Aeromicrobium sp.]